jgi:hypothetical protein
MKTTTLTTALIVATILTGCASTPQTPQTPRSHATLTIHTQPRGAYITTTSADGGRIGAAAPQQFIYTLAQANQEGGCWALQPVTATWVSGASTTTTPRICGAPNGDYNITISRDPTQAGLDKDLMVEREIAGVGGGGGGGGGRSAGNSRTDELLERQTRALERSANTASSEAGMKALRGVAGGW